MTVTGGATVNNTNSATLTLQNFLIGSNSAFIPYPLAPPTITILTNITIQAGGRFTADGASSSTTGGGQTLNLTGGGGQFDGTNVNFNWYGINGVTYQPYSSSNLVDWTPYGAPFAGGNAPITLALPPTDAPQMFFRLGVTY